MTIILTSDELEGVSGYRSSKRQLAELHRQGFYRARIGATGNTPALEKRIGVASTSPIYPMRLTPPPNHQRSRYMTPEQHAKAIEDAAEQYAYAYSIDDFKDRSKAFEVLQDAIWAGVSAAPEGWVMVPVDPTNAMLDALEEGGCSEGNYKAALAAAPKP